GLERGLDPPRLAWRRPFPDRRPGQRRRERRSEGAAEAAREPDLARGARVRGRLADRALAGRARGAATRGTLRRRGGPDMTAALVVGACLAAACVLLVALPFLREPSTRDDRLARPDELEQGRLALTEERDRAPAALQELEFDHRTGNISGD